MAQSMRVKSQELLSKVDEHAWDGEWYRRAYYDNGEPMGSKEQDACQIDLLPQCFSVMRCV